MYVPGQSQSWARRHSGTQARRGWAVSSHGPGCRCCLPLQPKNRGSLPRNLGAVSANFNRVVCLSTTENPKEPRTVNGTEIEAIRTCRTLVASRGRRAILPTSTHTRPVSSCRIAAQQPLPHHVQPLLWHVSTGISDLFAALASTRRHRLDPSTALERINSPHSEPEPWDSALCHGQQRNSPQSPQEHVPALPVLGALRIDSPPPPTAPFISP